MNTSSSTSSSTVIGVDIGGTKIAAGIVTAKGEVLHTQRAATPSALGAAAILNTVADLCQQLIAWAQGEKLAVHAVGVGAGGQIDINTGQVRYASSVIPGWQGAEIVKTLEKQLCLPVRVDNDVNVLALGEHRFGAAQPYQDVLFVGVGTGVGGAVIINNRLVHGASFGAGDIAHILVDYKGTRICGCGQPGHLEAYASGPAIAMRYSELAGLREICTLQTVSENARNGDQVAIFAIQEGAQILGKALVGVLALFDPQALVIGGGVIQLGEQWWRPLLSEIRSAPLPGLAQIQVHPAQLEQVAAIVGAATLIEEN